MRWWNSGLWFGVVVLVSVCARPAEAEPLRDGDIVFQESASRQSELVRRLTRSRWTHVGVVVLGRNGPLVLEAVSPVRLTPLARAGPRTVVMGNTWQSG